MPDFEDLPIVWYCSPVVAVAETIVLRIPLPHRALAPGRPRRFGLQQRCMWQFRLAVAGAVRGASGLADVLESPADVAVSIGTREARRIGAFWVPRSRDEMVAQASMAAATICDVAGVPAARIVVRKVETSPNWGPFMVVRVGPYPSASEV